MACQSSLRIESNFFILHFHDLFKNTVLLDDSAEDGSGVSNHHLKPSKRDIVLVLCVHASIPYRTFDIR